jgi:small-conductance mechanosensitive channel
MSGIIVGFASQELLLNLMAGISIFLTQPFVVGDIVDIKQGKTLIVSGTVSGISPLRTTFLDENSQAVTLPNKQLSDLIITNHGDASLMSKVWSAGLSLPNHCYW